MTVYIAIPRFALSGGNLVSLDLANYLSQQGLNVYCLSGFKIKKPQEVILVKPKRGTLNSLINMVAFLCSSVAALFLKNYIATHHLTSIFNCIKKCKFALVQDIEIDFYPEQLKPLGFFFWRQYLKSHHLIITNNTLAQRIGSQYAGTVNGFSFIPFEIDIYADDLKKNDLLAVVRDGSYKAPLRTTEVMNAMHGVDCIIVNSTRGDLTGDNVISNVDRDNFVRLLNESKIFLCLSKWEGLGLPNIEAYVAGCHVVSSPIPSAQILQKIDPDAISIIRDDMSVEEIQKVIYEIMENKKSKISFEEKSLRMKNLLKSRGEWFEYSKNIVIQGVNE